MRVTLAAVMMVGIAGTAVARDLTIATWNLGWHMSQAEASTWIRECGQPFALNAQSGLWEPATSGATKPGWQLRWGRDAKIKRNIAEKPPCDVFQSNFRIVPVTEAAYRKRAQQIVNLVTNLNADIIAFQEVSGEAAVKEILPNNGTDYEVCTFTDFKVQRLANRA